MLSDHVIFQFYVRLNNQRCIEEKRDCFTDASGAASLLGARQAKGSLKTRFQFLEVGYKVNSTEQPLLHVLLTIGS